MAWKRSATSYCFVRLSALGFARRCFIRIESAESNIFDNCVTEGGLVVVIDGEWKDRISLSRDRSVGDHLVDLERKLLSLGTERNRQWPMGMALRGYYTSDRHGEPWIDSHLDIRERQTGTGWVLACDARRRVDCHFFKVNTDIYVGDSHRHSGKG